MSADDLYEPDPSEPLALRADDTPAPGAYEGLECLRLEFSSRGDRVRGQLVLPPTSTTAPIVVLAHGLSGARNADGLDTIGARWAREGAAVAAIDFALHGERANAKMSPRLIETSRQALATGFSDRVSEILWCEFARQSLLDLRRLVDALEQLDRVDTKRLVYVGFSLGGILGAAFCGLDRRPRGAALAIAGAGPEGTPFAPTRYVDRIAPRPLLFVNATRDEVISKSQTERLFAAAAEPKKIEWFDAGHRDLPGTALKSIWQFARPLLGMD